MPNVKGLLRYGIIGARLRVGIKMSNKSLKLSFSICLVAVFVIQRLETGSFSWSVIGVALLSHLTMYFTSKRGIQKLIGEYPHPKRSKFIVALSWGSAAILMLIFGLSIILGELGKPEVNYRNFTVFVIVPILVPIALGVMRVPNVTKKTKTGSLCVVKKLVASTILFVTFFPLFNVTNTLSIDINSTPHIDLESLFRGFVGWSMVFCFYAGLLLFIFAVIDFTYVIKDLAIRKPRTPRQASKASRNGE